MNVCPVSEILVLDTEHERRTIRVVIKLSENECNNPQTSDISTSCVFGIAYRKIFKARPILNDTHKNPPTNLGFH